MLAKEIAGLAGEQIHLVDGHIFVGGVDRGIIQETTSQGVRLNPISKKTVLNGTVFVIGHHERSFDSRYENFGLVNVDNIKEILWPIF